MRVNPRLQPQGRRRRTDLATVWLNCDGRITAFDAGLTALPVCGGKRGCPGALTAAFVTTASFAAALAVASVAAAALASVAAIAAASVSTAALAAASVAAASVSTGGVPQGAVPALPW